MGNQKKINWRKISTILHRDLGYFFVCLTLVYAISGIALNHSSDWNPSFYVEQREVKLNLPSDVAETSEEMIKNELNRVGILNGYLMTDYPSKTKFKTYYKNGSLFYDLSARKGEYEIVSKRPLFFEINFVHKNPGGIWKWFSDFYSVSLITIAITGLFILKGKNGVKGRGKWLFGAGTICTVGLIIAML